MGMSAVRFVTDLLPALEATDGIEVERIGALPDYKEAAAAPVVSLGGSHSADNDWFDLTITVTVGGEEVPFAELFVALAGGQSHLILPSGTFFSLDREELRELAHLITEARGLRDDPGEGVRLSRFQASLWEDFQRLGVVSAQASRLGGLSTCPCRMPSIGESTVPLSHCMPPSGPTSTLDSTGWPFSTSIGSAAFWPTTWGSARRCRRWP